MGMDDNEVTTSGWALRGQRCIGTKQAERSTRYNVIAALNKNVLFAPFIFEGYSTRETYAIYLERVLIPVLRPGMVLVIDNASFHKSKHIIDLIQSIGCKILFLPSYSPDLNPIEHHWSALKNKIRAMKQSFGNFLDAAVATLAATCSN